MKKVFASLAIIALFAACKKDYTCECTVLGTTESSVIKDVKKSEAKDSCDAANALVSLFGGSCELK
jgi:hypothetical protein